MIDILDPDVLREIADHLDRLDDDHRAIDLAQDIRRLAGQGEDQSPITKEEMIDMFGDEMPVEAAQLIFEADDKTTLGQLRAKLRRIARQRRDEVYLKLIDRGTDCECWMIVNKVDEGAVRFVRDLRVKS